MIFLPTLLRLFGFQSGGKKQRAEAVLEYGYSPMGRRTFVKWSRDFNGDKKSGQTDYVYNSLGQLAEIKADGKTAATYSYDKLGRLSEKKMGDGTRIEYGHDAFGRIASMTVFSASGKTLTSLEYSWDKADQLVGRTWDGVDQKYFYDLAGQLRTVKTRSGKGSGAVAGLLCDEEYVYDIAGNMIEKTVGGRKTAMTYDEANRLLSMTEINPAGQTGNLVKFDYDPAGHLAVERSGNATTAYSYGLFEKVAAVTKPDGSQVAFNYWPDGQMAGKSRTTNPSSPSPAPADQDPKGYLWDGLALLEQGDSAFTIEPHVCGGVPLAEIPGKATQVTIISDFLATTIGFVEGENFTPTPLTAFGEPAAKSLANANAHNSGLPGPNFLPRFTGKHFEPDLKAYNFLFRNHQPYIGRWTAVDPAGFQDGINHWLYCRNKTLVAIDSFGLLSLTGTLTAPDKPYVVNGITYTVGLHTISTINQTTLNNYWSTFSDYSISNPPIYSQTEGSVNISNYFGFQYYGVDIGAHIHGIATFPAGTVGTLLLIQYINATTGSYWDVTFPLSFSDNPSRNFNTPPSKGNPSWDAYTYLVAKTIGGNGLYDYTVYGAFTWGFEQE